MKDPAGLSSPSDLGFRTVLIERSLADRLLAAAQRRPETAGDALSDIVVDALEEWLDRGQGVYGPVQMATLLSGLAGAGSST